jgi:hypothetical protein
MEVKAFIANQVEEMMRKTGNDTWQFGNTLFEASKNVAGYGLRTDTMLQLTNAVILV